MAEAALEGVTKRFGATVAVDSLSLAVADGEFIVLLGPTGAGKTTTLRLFAGLERPDAGEVRIAGSTVTSLAPADRDVAFVFQQYSLYPHYSVFDNLAFPLRAPGRKGRAADTRARVEEVAAMLRIEGKLANKATELSGGEMQRVSIGRALVREPNLFLMDEPLSSLDAKLREDLRVELKRVQRDLNATIVYVTHDQLEAMTLADRIGILEEGRLVQLAAPRVVYEAPATITAAQRLGSPQINLVPLGALGLGVAPHGAVQAGVRPEDIAVAEGGVAANVINVEHLGADTVALLHVEGREVHVLVDPETPLTEGSATHIAVREGAALWFDAEARLISQH
ncbi:MAG: ABC transporter ATP-binding protein [Pseudomonadota bacterium]